VRCLRQRSGSGALPAPRHPCAATEPTHKWHRVCRRRGRRSATARTPAIGTEPGHIFPAITSVASATKHRCFPPHHRLRGRSGGSACSNPVRAQPFQVIRAVTQDDSGTGARRTERAACRKHDSRQVPIRAAPRSTRNGVRHPQRDWELHDRCTTNPLASDPRLGFWWSKSEPRIRGWHNPSLGSEARALNPSRCRLPLGYAVFLKRTRPRAERADGQPLARLTPGFLPLTAMSVP
jgi:hypothetical protein